METNEIFAFVVVGVILIAAAIPLGGIIFRRKKYEGVKESQASKKTERHPSGLKNLFPGKL